MTGPSSEHLQQTPTVGYSYAVDIVLSEVETQILNPEPEFCGDGRTDEEGEPVVGWKAQMSFLRRASAAHPFEERTPQLAWRGRTQGERDFWRCDARPCCDEGLGLRAHSFREQRLHLCEGVQTLQSYLGLGLQRQGGRV